jgi:hypothetical protein
MADSLLGHSVCAVSVHPIGNSALPVGRPPLTSYLIGCFSSICLAQQPQSAVVLCLPLHGGLSIVGGKPSLVTVSEKAEPADSWESVRQGDVMLSCCGREQATSAV